MDTNIKQAMVDYFARQISTQLDTVSLKIFRIVLSHIKENKHPNVVKVSRKEILNFLSEKESTNYTQIKDIIIHTLLPLTIGLTNDKGKEYYLHIFSGIIYPDSTQNETITFVFLPCAFPYILESKQNFSQYDIKNIKSFHSKYSILIYEYLVFQMANNFFKYGTYNIGVAKLRVITGTKDIYEVFKDFEKRVIVPAVNEINEGKCEFLIKYNKIKENNKVVTISFELSVNPNSFKCCKTTR